MKVMCVTTDYTGNWSSFSAKLMLTIGNWYDVLDGGDGFYTIVVDKGYVANLSKSYFKTIDEIRNQKLKELGV